MPSRFPAAASDVLDGPSSSTPTIPPRSAAAGPSVLDWKIVVTTSPDEVVIATGRQTGFPGIVFGTVPEREDDQEPAAHRPRGPTTATPRSIGSSRSARRTPTSASPATSRGSCSPIPKATSSACCRRAKAGCSATYGRSGARQAEHALGDDVALDLARAAGDRRRRTSAGTGSPTSPRATSAGRGCRCRARRHRAPRRRTSSAFCTASLPKSFSSECSGDGLAVQELREAAVAHREQRLRVDVEAGDRVAEARRRRRAGRRPAPRSIAELDERVDDALHVVRVVDPQHRPLVRERALRDRPAAVAARRAGSPAGRATSVKNTSLKSQKSGSRQLGERPRARRRASSCR